MRDVNKMREYIERKTWGKHDRSSQPAGEPRSKPEPSPRAWRASDAVLRPASAEERVAHRQLEATTDATVSGKHTPNTLTARSVKVTVPLDPAAVAALEAREGGPSRIKLAITFDGGTLRTEVAAKSVRKAQKTITENGPEAVFCILQGKLGRNEIMECGLVAQVKASKDGGTGGRELR